MVHFVFFWDFQKHHFPSLYIPWLEAVQLCQPTFKAAVFLVVQNSDLFYCTYTLLYSNGFILMFWNYEGRQDTLSILFHDRKEHITKYLT